jgi:sugar lactone lactonase YvrE
MALFLIFQAATQAKDRNALVRPHDVVVSKDGRTLYVAEIGPNRLSKFNIKH